MSRDIKQLIRDNAPAGYLGFAEAARQLGMRYATLANSIHSLGVHTIRRGRWRYVWEADLPRIKP